MIGFKWLHIVLVTVGIAGAAYGEKLDMSIRWMGFDKPSSFSPQLLVRVSNESFTSAPLADKIASSTLLVDGRAFTRTGAMFHGPAGLSPKSSWEGCMAFEDYMPGGLPPGTHTLEFRSGGIESKPIHVNQARKILPAATAEDRLRQVKALSDIVSPGLLRSCVENWLTEKDGGLQTMDQTRYYVDPDVKIIVSYEDAAPEPRVRSPLKLYTEARIVD